MSAWRVRTSSLRETWVCSSVACLAWVDSERSKLRIRMMLPRIAFMDNSCCGILVVSCHSITALGHRVLNWRIGIITGLFDRKSEYRIRSVACLFYGRV